MTRVRSESAMIAALIRKAADRSPTFTALTAAIDATNGIVYVTPGRCGRARVRAHACLLHEVVVAGPDRVLHIVVEPQRDEVGLIAAIAHELQHAVEVLSDERIAKDYEVFAFYRSRGLKVRGQFETQSAIQKGDAVRSELQRSLRP